MGQGIADMKIQMSIAAVFKYSNVAKVFSMSSPAISIISDKTDFCVSVMSDVLLEERMEAFKDDLKK